MNVLVLGPAFLYLTDITMMRFVSCNMICCWTHALVVLFQAESVEDYEDLHTFPVRDPDTICDWEEDDTFARLRLQGEGRYGGGGALDDVPYRVIRVDMSDLTRK